MVPFVVFSSGCSQKNRTLRVREAGAPHELRVGGLQLAHIYQPRGGGGIAATEENAPSPGSLSLPLVGFTPFP